MIAVLTALSSPTPFSARRFLGHGSGTAGLALALALALAGGGAARAQQAAPPATPASPPAPASSAAPVGSQKLTPTVPVDARWLPYDAALVKAKADQKDLLVLFTGPDWIPLCLMFDDKILNKASFLDPVTAHFVPARLEYPRFRQQSDQEREANEILMRVYRVSGFPAIILTDEIGRPYAVTGFQPMPPSAYAESLETLRQTRLARDKAFAEAATLTGLEKAQKLATGIPALPGNLGARFYRKEMEDVIALDSANTTGKVENFRALIADVDYATKMAELGEAQKWDEMIALTDTHIIRQKLTGSPLQNALMNKAGLYEKKGDKANERRTLVEIISAGADSPLGQKASAILKNFPATSPSPSSSQPQP